MQIKLTFRYIVVVMVSTILLVVSAYSVLSYLDNNYYDEDDAPTSYAYNLGEEVIMNELGEADFTPEGQESLLNREGWLQILDEEGYVVYSFNTPHYVADHYDPLEINYIGASKSFSPKYIYDVGRSTEGINYLVAVPSEGWFQMTLEMDKEMMRQYMQIMLVVMLVIFLIMGFIFSRRIAKPVTQIIQGVKGLSDGDYEPKYKEKGLYKPVFKQLNQLGSRLQLSEIERRKTKDQREKWISNISHDLKTPLSTIKGYSEILADVDYSVSNEEVTQYSKSIYEKSIYMEEMIEELRLNEQLMQDKVTLNKESVDLKSFVYEIIEDILKHPDFTDRTIVFQAEENITVNVSKDLMHRAIENLIYNALIHNDLETIVTVDVRVIGEESIIEIMDNGQGMNPEELEQLFNRYYRGLNTKNYKGAGLGMSIAKEVIEAHGGEIDVNSEIDKGTVIKIILSIT